MNGKIISVLFVLMTAFVPLAPSGQSAEVKIMTIPVTEQIFMITGKGGNIGLFIGADGTFLIDDQYAPLTEKIVAAIKSVGGDLPKFLINTHYHGDHTGGNENLGQGGTLIFSHDNVRERLSRDSFIEPFNMKREAVSREGLPVVTFIAEAYRSPFTVHRLLFTKLLGWSELRPTSCPSVQTASELCFCLTATTSLT